MELLMFICISFGFIAIPGPNVLVVISTSLSYGTMRGLQTAAGIGLAMLVQLGIAVLGTTWFVAALTQGFLWLKWAGVAYLVYLGIRHLIYAVSGKKPESRVTALALFQRGFWVSLTNPKTILFFSAFLPQFTVPSSTYFPQIILLSLIFWCIAFMVNCGYVVLACRFSSLLKSKAAAKYQHGSSGLFYIGAAAALAASKNGQ